jgi:hypothetical protein
MQELVMSNEENESPSYTRWKARENSEKLGKRVFRRTIRFYAFLVGVGFGIFTIFTTSGNSILGILLLPIIIGGAFAFLVTVLMSGLGL